jgi:hypothetical protein
MICASTTPFTLKSSDGNMQGAENQYIKLKKNVFFSGQIEITGTNKIQFNQRLRYF